MSKGTHIYSNRHRMHERNTDYHDRLEQEVTTLKRQLVEAETQITQLQWDNKKLKEERDSLLRIL